MNYLDQLDKIDFENTPPLPTDKTDKRASVSNVSDQGYPFSKNEFDLHGWTLEQIRDHCHPDEWAEIKDNNVALEAVAANLREYPFLWDPMYRDHYLQPDKATEAERRERESKLQLQQAAGEFYDHIFSPGTSTGCCYAPGNHYCPEGMRLRERYRTTSREGQANGR